MYIKIFHGNVGAGMHSLAKQFVVNKRNNTIVHNIFIQKFLFYGSVF